jgi:hypothetical protein
MLFATFALNFIFLQNLRKKEKKANEIIYVTHNHLHHANLRLLLPCPSFALFFFSLFKFFIFHFFYFAIYVLHFIYFYPMFDFVQEWASMLLFFIFFKFTLI